MTSAFLLDTNVASEFARPVPDPHVVQWVERRSDHFLSVITLGELRKGFSLLPAGKRQTQLLHWFDRQLLPMIGGRILPVTQSIADRWGILSAERQRRGIPLSMADGLIAATALVHDLTVVTRNVKDFSGLGVPLINPWDPT